MTLPRAVLLDLDDTILDDSGHAARCWREACEEHTSYLEGLDPAALHEAIERIRAWFWSDAERHRIGRLDLPAAHRDVVGRAFDEVGLSRTPAADRIATAYYARRSRAIAPFPDAVETVRWLRETGCRLALLTNGAGAPQRDKIDRFGLADLFDAILIEGELGYGKPDPRVYRRALERLEVDPSDTWMVGDHPEWDVAAPQREGIFGVWVDRWERGLADGLGVRPDRIVRRLAELRVPEPPFGGRFDGGRSPDHRG